MREGTPPVEERVDQLVRQPRSDRLIGSVLPRPLFWQVKRAEAFVNQGQHGSIILVDVLRPIVGVVPVVECRRGDQPLQPTKAPAKVGMDEESPDGL